MSQKLNYITSLHSHTRSKVVDGIQNQPKSLPCHVSKILDNDFIEIAFDVVSGFTLPKVQIPQSFSGYVREPTQVGDKGYLVPNDITMSQVSGLINNPATLFSRGNLSTGSFQPTSNKNMPTKDKDTHLVTGGPNGIILQNNAGSGAAPKDAEGVSQGGNVKVTIEKDKTTILAGKNVITVNANGDITVDPSGTTHKVYLGGDGKTGQYVPILLADMTPSPNVFARKS